MGTIISNNTSSGVISTPDYWSPGFDLTGCVYAGLFNLPELTTNLAPVTSGVTQLGTTVRDGVFPRFKAGTFQLNTGLTVGSKASTFIAVYKKIDALGMGSFNRCFLVSSYVGSGEGGASLVLEGGGAAGPNPPNVTVYRVLQSLGQNTQSAAGGNTPSSDGWSISVARSWNDPDTGNCKVRIYNALNGGSSSGTATTPMGNSTNFISIGGTPSSSSTSTQEVTMASALVFNRALEDSELPAIVSYYRRYLKRFNINV